MRELIIIEGIHCSGKTYLSEKLSEKLGFKIHCNLDPDHVDNANKLKFGRKVYSKEINYKDYWLAEILTTVRYGDKLIIDRSMMSWIFYNGLDLQFLQRYLEYINDTKHMFIFMEPSISWVKHHYKLRDNKISNELEIREAMSIFSGIANIFPVVYSADPGEDNCIEKMLEAWKHESN